MSGTGPVIHGHNLTKKENNSRKLHCNYILHLFLENRYFSLCIHIYVGDMKLFVLLEIRRPSVKMSTCDNLMQFSKMC